MSADLIERCRSLASLPHIQCLARARDFGEGAVSVLRRSASVEAAPRVLVTAGIHGDEPAGSWALADLLHRDALPREVEWTLLPCLNVTGLRNNCRENAEGIDLNRDFLHCRSREVAFYVETIPKFGPYDLLLSLHEDWEFQESYVYEINTSCRCGCAAGILRVLGDCTGLVTAPCIDDHFPIEPGLIVHEPEADEPDNWPESIYMVKKFPLLAYTLETPSALPLDLRVQCQQRVLAYVASFLAQDSAKLDRSLPEGS